MPFPILAHQAPVLPLKAWRPRWFDGVALVIGSMAPDFGYAYRDWNEPNGFGHTISDQFTFCLPVTLALTLVLTVGILPSLARYLPQGAPWHLDDVRYLARPPRTLRAWGIAVISSLAGSFSHIALDGMTHRNGWITRFAPSMAHVYLVHGYHVMPVRALQYAFTVIGAVLSTWVLARWLRERRFRAWAGVTADAPDRVVGRHPWLIWGSGAIAAVVGMQQTWRVLQRPWLVFENGAVYVWGFIAFRVSCIASVGVCAGAVIAAWFDLRAARTGNVGEATPPTAPR